MKKYVSTILVTLSLLAGGAVAFAQNTKATVSLHDLKLILDLSGRTPTAQDVEINTKQNFTMNINISARDRQSLHKLLVKLDSERVKLEQEIAQEQEKTKSEIAQKRKQIQARRISGSQSDSLIAQELFNSVLAEANMKARAQKALEEFDNDNQIALQLIETNGSKTIAMIQIGNDVVWNRHDVVTYAAR